MKIISLILLLMTLSAASARADNDATEAMGDSCMKINDTFNAMRYYGEALQTDSSDAIKGKNGALPVYAWRIPQMRGNARNHGKERHRQSDCGDDAPPV
mgnify:CR=1 FL=1